MGPLLPLILLHIPALGMGTETWYVVSGRMQGFPSLEVGPLVGVQVLPVPGRVCAKAWGWLVCRFFSTCLAPFVPSVCDQLCPWTRKLILTTTTQH